MQNAFRYAPAALQLLIAMTVLPPLFRNAL